MSLFYSLHADLALSITWLVFTASSQARSKANSCGNPVPCATYTCDFAWDIVFSLLWLTLLILTACLGDTVGPICAGIQFGFVTASSVLSGMARKEAIQALASAQAPSTGKQAMLDAPPTIIVSQ